MNSIPWIVAALLTAGVLVVLSAARTRRSIPPLQLPAGESLPKTDLQRYTGWALAVIGLLFVVAAGIVVHFGAQTWWDDDAVRWTVTFVLIAAFAVFLAFAIKVGVLEKRGEGTFDERDKAILMRSRAGVGGAMMIVAAAWMIGLTETYIETRLVPSYFLQLIFWSLVMTDVVATLAGILLAYRRA